MAYLRAKDTINGALGTCFALINGNRYEIMQAKNVEAKVEKTKSEITINLDEDNLDGLNYITGKTLDYVNKKAMEGTIKAHVEGGVPNIVINIEKLNEEAIGHLIYFFELACAVSGKLLGINPFDQPGVEKYKINMFKLLGKPGYKE